MQRNDHEDFIHADELKTRSARSRPAGGSLSYMAVGSIIGLRGLLNGRDYFGVEQDQTDAFIQHHAPVYRHLMEMHFGLPLTTEQSPELAPPAPHVTTPLAP